MNMNETSPTPAIDAINEMARREAVRRQNGKGSIPRPTKLSRYGRNYDRIFRRNKKP